MGSLETSRNGKRSRVVLVDDHPIVRFALARLINQEEDLEVCADAGNYEEALHAVLTSRPAIVLVDICLGDIDGLELTRTIRHMDAHLPVLVLSMRDETHYAARALAAGAQGYVMKQEGPDIILRAVRTVLGGERYLSARMMDRSRPTLAAP